MKKVLFFALALMSAAIFNSCRDSLTPDGDKTQLWPAGKNNSEKWGYINKSGDFKIDPKYDACATFSCGLAMARVDGDVMFIDKSGKKVKAVDAENVYDYYFYYNLCRFQDGEYTGMWDKKFNVVIPADYKHLGLATKDGLIACSEDGKEYVYINEKGKQILSGDFIYAYPFVDGMAVVVIKEGTKDEPKYMYGVIGKNGKFIVEPQKNGLMSMGEGRLGLQKSTGKVVLVDKALNEIGSSYDSGGAFSCGLARVYKDEKGYGFVDKNGNEVIPCKFYRAWDFTDDVTFAVKSSDSKVWEVVDKKGETLFKLKEYDYPQDGFHNGLALICHEEYTDGKYVYNYRYVNKKGETVYKWEPGEEEDEAPKSNWEELNRKSLMQTEVGAIVREIEEMNALMAR